MTHAVLFLVCSTNAVRARSSLPVSRPRCLSTEETEEAKKSPKAAYQKNRHRAFPLFDRETSSRQTPALLHPLSPLPKKR
jgi:hypothetical protein